MEGTPGPQRARFGEVAHPLEERRPEARLAPGRAGAVHGDLDGVPAAGLGVVQQLAEDAANRRGAVLAVLAGRPAQLAPVVRAPSDPQRIALAHPGAEPERERNRQLRWAGVQEGLDFRRRPRPVDLSRAGWAADQLDRLRWVAWAVAALLPPSEGEAEDLDDVVAEPPPALGGGFVAELEDPGRGEVDEPALRCRVAEPVADSLVVGPRARLQRPPLRALPVLGPQQGVGAAQGVHHSRLGLGAPVERPDL